MDVLESCESPPTTWLTKASERPIESIDILEYIEGRMLSLDCAEGVLLMISIFEIELCSLKVELRR